MSIQIENKWLLQHHSEDHITLLFIQSAEMQITPHTIRVTNIKSAVSKAPFSFNADAVIQCGDTNAILSFLGQEREFASSRDTETGAISIFNPLYGIPEILSIVDEEQRKAGI